MSAPPPLSTAYWRPLFDAVLRRARPSPARWQLRAGQGVHLILFDADDLPFHASLHPRDQGVDGPVHTKHATLRYAGPDALRPDHRAWLQAIARVAEVADREPRWPGFLQWAAERPGISLPDVHADGARRTSGGDVLIRLLEPCNARCDFCSCIGVMPDRAMSLDDVRDRLQAARREGRTAVTFTGGEPTLFKGLPEAVRLARDAGFTEVGLQTNGTKLDDVLTPRLAREGLSSLFLSLHGHTPALHDPILKLEGAFDLAIQGIDHALHAGLLVRLNHVICADNAAHVPDFARFVADRWRDRVAITWSFVSPIGWALEHPEVLPRITEVRPGLDAALRVCTEVGIPTDVPGLCGLPRCVLPHHEALFAEAHDTAPPPQLETRRHVAACDACTRRDTCSGYWRVYLDRFGESELGPPPAWTR